MPLTKQKANEVRALVLPLCIASSMIGTALDTSFSHPNPFKRHLEVFYYTRNHLKSQAHLNMFHAQRCTHHAAMKWPSRLPRPALLLA